VAPTETPEPEDSFLGQNAEDGGMFLQALTVADPAEPGLFFQPESGKRLIGVEIVVGNQTADPFSTNVLNSTLLDADGFTYTPELGAVDGQLDLVDLMPGERARGWVAFLIPDAAQPAIIKFTPGYFGGNALRTRLTPPEDGSGPEALPERTSPELTHLGDVFEQDGYSLSASAVQDPATPGMFYTGIPGTRLVAVEMTVGNVDGERISTNILNSFLVDTNGFVYSAELGAVDGQIDLVEIGRGEKAKGYTAFAIAQDAQPEALKFVVSPTIILVVGLGQ
jgi:hypothetical protein